MASVALACVSQLAAMARLALLCINPALAAAAVWRLYAAGWRWLKSESYNRWPGQPGWQLMLMQCNGVTSVMAVICRDIYQ